MTRIEYDRDFTKQAMRLDVRLRKKLMLLTALMAHNPYDPRLHTKPLSEPFGGILSFRITRDWRVTFHFIDAKTVRLLEIRHRSDIYR